MTRGKGTLTRTLSFTLFWGGPHVHNFSFHLLSSVNEKYCGLRDDLLLIAKQSNLTHISEPPPRKIPEGQEINRDRVLRCKQEEQCNCSCMLWSNSYAQHTAESIRTMAINTVLQLIRLFSNFWFWSGQSGRKASSLTDEPHFRPLAPSWSFCGVCKKNCQAVTGTGTWRSRQSASQLTGSRNRNIAQEVFAVVRCTTRDAARGRPEFLLFQPCLGQAVRVTEWSRS